MKKYKGEFWLAGEEDKSFLGEIRLGKKKSELSLIIPAGDKLDEGKFLQSDPLRPVLGVTTCGKRITLTDYFQVFFPHSFHQPRCAKFCINEAFVGLPSEIGECDPKVDTAVIASKPLVEWCGKNPIEEDSGQIWAARYSPPDSKEIYKDKDCTIQLFFGARMQSSRTSASIDANTCIEIKAEKPLAWSRLFTTLSIVMDVVSIGCGGYCKISRAYAASKDPLFIADYHFHSLYRDAKVPAFPQWLFTLRDLPDSAFTKWMEKADELSRARGLFFSARHHKMFAETRVILLTQAVEAYYRRMYRDDYKLSKHLKQLCDEYAAPISVVFPDWQPRVYEVVKFRGQQTHSPIKMPTASMESGDRQAIEYFLVLLLESCFMSQLGISTADMTQIVERSFVYSQLKVLYSR